jgi:hypothetical protein
MYLARLPDTPSPLNGTAHLHTPLVESLPSCSTGHSPITRLTGHATDTAAVPPRPERPPTRRKPPSANVMCDEPQPATPLATLRRSRHPHNSPCPMPVCNGIRGQRWRGADNPQLLQHLLDRHREEGLSQYTLQGLGAVRSTGCGVFRSATGGNHTCEWERERERHLQNLLHTHEPDPLTCPTATCAP